MPTYSPHLEWRNPCVFFHCSSRGAVVNYTFNQPLISWFVEAFVTTLHITDVVMFDFNSRGDSHVRGCAEQLLIYYIASSLVTRLVPLLFKTLASRLVPLSHGQLTLRLVGSAVADFVCSFRLTPLACRHLHRTYPS